MQIPPVSGPSYTQGPGEDPSSVFTRLRSAWMVNPNRETAQKLLQYIQQHHSELRDLADEKAEDLDEEGLPFPEVPFEKAYKQATELLKNWIEGGCDNTKFTEIRTKVMQLAAWVSRGVCEE